MIKKIVLIMFSAFMLASCVVIRGNFWTDDDEEEVLKDESSGGKKETDDEMPEDEPGVTPDPEGYVPCPYEIKQKVFHYAELYCKSDTYYKYGGQDSLRSIGIDCSGLVIMCYQYALEGTNYELMLPDMSSAYMKDNASIPTENPQKGDLIFMGEFNSSNITHIAIFEKMDNHRVYFIDSTEYGNVSGVTRRSYEKNNSKFKSYGVMKIKKKK